MGWHGMGWDAFGLVVVAIVLSGLTWDGMGWDGVGWDGMGWDGMGCFWACVVVAVVLSGLIAVLRMHVPLQPFAVGSRLCGLAGCLLLSLCIDSLPVAQSLSLVGEDLLPPPPGFPTPGPVAVTRATSPLSADRCTHWTYCVIVCCSCSRAAFRLCVCVCFV